MHFLLIIFSLSLWAEKSSWLEAYTNKVLLNETVVFRAKNGFHFSHEAPQRCGTGDRHVLDSRKNVICQFKASGATVATLNICDDQGKTCRPVEASVTVGGDTNAGPQVQSPAADPKVQQGPLPGFWTGSVEAIRDEAKRRGQPIFLVISTDWCWPCQMMKDLVFTTPEFLERSQPWFRVYIDGDQSSAREWEKLTLLNGYPTIALFNHQFELIDARYGGDRKDISDWESAVNNNLNDPITHLEKRMRDRWSGAPLRKLKDFFVSHKSKQADQERFSKWVRSADVSKDLKDLEEAHVQVSGVKALQRQYYNWQMNSAAEDKPTPEQLALLKELVAQRIGNSRWTFYLSHLCELDIKSCRLTQKEMDLHISGLRAETPDEVDLAFASGEAYASFSRILKKLGNKREAKLQAEKCRTGYDQLQIKSSVWKKSRVVNQHIISCLSELGDQPQALAKTRSIVENDPENIYAVWDLISKLRDQNKTKEAFQWFAKADGMGTPNQRVMNQITRAEFLIELKRNREARIILTGLLDKIKISPTERSVEQNMVSQIRYNLKRI